MTLFAQSIIFDDIAIYIKKTTTDSEFSFSLYTYIGVYLKLAQSGKISNRVRKKIG